MTLQWTIHQRFPKLKIAAAHLGGFGMWDEVEEMLIGEDVFLDAERTDFQDDSNARSEPNSIRHGCTLAKSIKRPFRIPKTSLNR